MRPLYDDGAGSAAAATRDYVLKYDDDEGAPVLNVFGGKITTYRKLAEQALALISASHPQATKNWTGGVALPGGNFSVKDIPSMISKLKADYAFLDDIWANRLIRAYGSEAKDVLQNAEKVEDLGEHFGASLTEREVLWLIEQEFAGTAEDVVWRRTKLGLTMDKNQISRLDEFIEATIAKHAGLKHKSSVPICLN